MMKWNNLTQMECNALYAFGVPDKRETIDRLLQVSDLANEEEFAVVFRTLARKLAQKNVTKEAYQTVYYTVRHRKELVLIRTTVEYQEKYDDPENCRPWAGLAKILITSVFGDPNIRLAIEKLEKLRRFVADEALKKVVRELMEEMRDIEYLCPNLYVLYLMECREYHLSKNFKTDEQILSCYKDGGYTGELA